MRVLVTGGFGFIGSHVLRRLVDAGGTVGCLDIAEPSPIAADVLDDIWIGSGDVTDPGDVYSAVASFEPDRIVHLASLLGRACERDPRRAVAVNVQGTVHVLEAAETLGVDRVVAASSASTYGSMASAESDHLTEDTIQRPASIYGLTKYAIERIGSTIARNRSIGFAAIQPVHSLGPDRVRGNVEDAYVVKAAVSGTPITVPRIDHPFEIVSVIDVASAFVMATRAETLPHGTYLVGSGERTTLADLVELLRDLVPGARLELGTDRGDDHLFERPASDPARIEDDLGWVPTRTIEETVAGYVDWLQEHPDGWSFDGTAVPWPSPGEPDHSASGS